MEKRLIKTTKEYSLDFADDLYKLFVERQHNMWFYRCYRTTLDKGHLDIADIPFIKGGHFKREKDVFDIVIKLIREVREDEQNKTTI